MISRKHLECQYGNFGEKLGLETEVCEPCTGIHGLETLSVAEVATDEWK